MPQQEQVPQAFQEEEAHEEFIWLQARQETLREAREAFLDAFAALGDGDLNNRWTFLTFVDKALATLKDQQPQVEEEVCERCKGSRVEEVWNGRDEMDRYGCELCQGTGKRPTDTASKPNAPSVPDQFPAPQVDEAESSPYRSKRWPENPNDLAGKLKASFERPDSSTESKEAK